MNDLEGMSDNDLDVEYAKKKHKIDAEREKIKLGILNTYDRNENKTEFEDDYKDKFEDEYKFKQTKTMC